MKDDILSLYDRGGQLLVKTTRGKNRLYKVILEVDLVKCLQVEACGENNLWHARLGHINHETMRMMANKELVAGLPSVDRSTEACVSCLRGKQPENLSLKQPIIEQQSSLSWYMLIYVDLSLHKLHLTVDTFLF